LLHKATKLSVGINKALVRAFLRSRFKIIVYKLFDITGEPSDRATTIVPKG
jgi:hypothetical protein